MATIHIKELDRTRVLFEAAMYRAGEGKAKRAFTRALNSTGKKAFTATKRALHKQSSIKRGTINQATRFRRATFSRLSFEIVGRGEYISLKEFGAKQFSYGVKAKVWEGPQQYQGAFIWAGTNRSGVPVAGGHVFTRLTGKSLPIKKLWGPSIPVEMLRDPAYQVFVEAGEDVKVEALRQIEHVLP